MGPQSPSSPSEPRTEIELSDTALICGWWFPPDALAVPVSASGLAEALARRDGVTWLHFSLTDARAAHFLVNSPLVPARLSEALDDHSRVPGVSIDADGWLAVMNDLEFASGDEIEDPVTLWAWADDRLAITVRNRPAASADALRYAVRNGERMDDGFEVLLRIVDLRTELLSRLVERHSEALELLEESILSGHVPAGRDALGRARLQCGRVRRHFLGDRAQFGGLVSKQSALLAPRHVDRVGEVVADLSHLAEAVGELYERARILQEEISAQVAQETSQRLFVLSILSAVLLPMTLVTGIWGMNVGGLPGVESETGSAFWWVLGLVFGVGVMMLVILRRLRLL